jgi:hypothetical protein
MPRRGLAPKGLERLALVLGLSAEGLEAFDALSTSNASGLLMVEPVSQG